MNECGLWVAVHPSPGEHRALSEEAYTEAIRRLDSWWSPRYWSLVTVGVPRFALALTEGRVDEHVSLARQQLAEYRDARQDLIDDLTAIIPPAAFADDHEVLIQLVNTRVEQVESFNVAVEAGDLTAAGFVMVPVPPEEAGTGLKNDEGEITDLRGQLSPEFRIISALDSAG